MTILEKCIRNCKHGIKALQNLKGSLEAFDKIQSGSIEDRLLNASLFHYAVIKYAKPFSETRVTANIENEFSKLRDHAYCDLAANSSKSPLHSTDLARSIKNFHEGDSAIPSQFSTANGYLFDEIQFTLTCNDFSVVEGSSFICSETVFF